MSWWSTILSSSKSVDDILDKDNGLLAQMGGWVGNFNFTDEERSEMNKKLIDNCSEFVYKTMGESTARSVARRSLALLWVRVHLAMIIGVMVVAYFDMALATFYFSIVFGPLMLSSTLGIMAFFFGSHMLSSHMGFGKKKKD